MEKRYVTGIDVGTSAIKVLTACVYADGKLEIIGSGIVPATGYDKGVVKDMSALAGSIRQAVECVGIAADIPNIPAYVGIGGEAIHSFNSIGTVAPSSPEAINAEDVARACRAAAITSAAADEYVLHTIPISYSIDGQKQYHQPLAQTGACLEVETHVVTAKSGIFGELTAALNKVGVAVAQVVANPIVSAEACTLGIDRNNCLFLDIGAGTTDLVLYREGQPYNSASLPFGGDYITSDIMQAVGVSHIHAEAIKRYYNKLDKNLLGKNMVLDCNDYGTTDKHVAYDFLHNVVESRVEEIAALVCEYIKTSLNETTLGTVYVSGGCAIMNSITTALERVFGQPVSTIQPEHLHGEYASPVFSAGFGILHYAAKHLPASKNKKHQGREGLHSWWTKVKKLF